MKYVKDFENRCCIEICNKAKLRPDPIQDDHPPPPPTTHNKRPFDSVSNLSGVLVFSDEWVMSEECSSRYLGI
jgi:hypothetical protein